MRSLPFLFSEAFVNLRRHGLMTVAAVTTIAVALALIGVFALTFFQITIATNRAEGEFQTQVFCRQTVTKAQIPEIRKRIAAIPGVGRVDYISKEQAFADTVRDMPIDTTGLPNIMNETFVITMSDPTKAESIKSEISSWHDIVQEISLPDTDLGRVMKIANFLRTIGAIGGLFLLTGTLVVVSNTVRISLFARRREIKIMQIVGASGWFIRLPLLIEGLIQGLLGGILAAACLIAVGDKARAFMQSEIPMMARYFEPVDMIRFGGAVAIAGILIGAIGSLLSMRRYLRIETIR